MGQRTETEHSEVLDLEELTRERGDRVAHEIELQDVSFLARILDRLRTLERTRA